MCETKSHYAVTKKAELFWLFDEGKRPCDIGDAPVSRKTLYQYFCEWRRERGIKGKKTGFAIKRFDRKAYLQAKKEQELRKDKEKLIRWVEDYEIVLDALGQWAEALKEGEAQSLRVRLPGRRGSYWVSHLLRYKKAPRTKEERLAIVERNIAWLETWIEIGRQAQSMSEFKELCAREVGGYPPEVEDY